MQVAYLFSVKTLWSNGKTPSSYSMFYESEGWWLKSPPGRGMFFHYTPQLHSILQDFLLPRDGSHLSAKCSKFKMPNFLLFDVFRRTLKVPGENPDLIHQGMTEDI